MEILELILLLIVFIGIPLFLAIPLYNAFLIRKARNILSGPPASKSSLMTNPNFGFEWAASALKVRSYILERSWESLDSQEKVQEFERIYLRLKISKIIFIVYMLVLAIVFFFIL